MQHMDIVMDDRELEEIIEMEEDDAESAAVAHELLDSVISILKSNNVSDDIIGQIKALAD